MSNQNQTYKISVIATSKQPNGLVSSVCIISCPQKAHKIFMYYVDKRQHSNNIEDYYCPIDGTYNYAGNGLLVTAEEIDNEAE